MFDRVTGEVLHQAANVEEFSSAGDATTIEAALATDTDMGHKMSAAALLWDIVVGKRPIEDCPWKVRSEHWMDCAATTVARCNVTIFTCVAMCTSSIAFSCIHWLSTYSLCRHPTATNSHKFLACCRTSCMLFLDYSPRISILCVCCSLDKHQSRYWLKLSRWLGPPTQTTLMIRQLVTR